MPPSRAVTGARSRVSRVLERRSRRVDPGSRPERPEAIERGRRVSTTSSSSTKGPKVPYRCSFCGKSQEQVRKLIAGQGVYICDECINLCQEIIEEEMLEQPKAKTPASKLPNPRQITDALDQCGISQHKAKNVAS